MIKLSNKVLDTLNNTRLLNRVLSPVWIVKIDTTFTKGVYRVKPYLLFTNTQETVKEISFTIKTRFYSYKTIASVFSTSIDFEGDNVKNCMFEMPDDYHGSDFTLFIDRVTFSSTAIDYTNTPITIMEFDISDDPKNEYLSDLSPDYAQFPRLFKGFWQCSCRFYNSDSDAHCHNCGANHQEIVSQANTGINDFFISQYLSNSPMVFDYKHTFDENLKLYIASITEKYNIDEALIIKRIDTKEEQTRYRSTFQKYIGEISSNLIHERKVNRKKKQISVLSSFFAVIALLALVFGYQVSVYASGYNKLQNGNFLEARTEFKKILGFLNSKDMYYESTLQLARSIYDENPNRAIQYLESIPDQTYKNLNETYYEYVYQFALSTLNQGKYVDASLLFKKIDYRDSNDLYKESIYLLAKQYYFTYSNYDQSISTIKTILGYKDSLDLYHEWKYVEATRLINNKVYGSAISILEELDTYKDSRSILIKAYYDYASYYFAQKNYVKSAEYFIKAGNYRDSSTKTKESYYQLAMQYYKQKSYSESLNYFLKIPGYKDANSKIKTIESLVSSWKAIIYFNTFANSTTDSLTISRYSDLYVHFRVTGGKSGEPFTPKIVYTYPDGDSYSYTFDFSIYSGDSNYIYWDGGIYSNPDNGLTGLFKIQLYNARTGILVATDYVQITK